TCRPPRRTTAEPRGASRSESPWPDGWCAGPTGTTGARRETGRGRAWPRSLPKPGRWPLQKDGHGFAAVVVPFVQVAGPQIFVDQRPHHLGCIFVHEVGTAGEEG